VRIGIDFRGAQCAGGSAQRGIGRYIYELVRGILEFAPEHEVVLFVNDSSDPALKDLKGAKVVPVIAPTWSDPKKPFWMKIPKVRSSINLHRKFLESTIVAQKVAMEKALSENRVEILHVPSGLDIGSYPIFDSTCPVVYTLLDTIVFSLPHLFYNKMPLQLREYYDRQVDFLRSKKLIAISESTKHCGIQEFGFSAENIQVVYPAVDPSFLAKKPKQDWISEPYYLFCSVPDLHKNPLLVIEAFAKSGVQGRLIFISRNQGQYVDDLWRVAKQFGVENRLHLTGFVEQEALVSLFQHAEALISPSKMEGFGYPVAQAMMSGTPVITSKFHAQAEIAEGIGWLVDPNSADEIADAIRKVDRSKVQLGKQRAEMFYPQKTTQQLIFAYESILKTALS
jgi:glycosyltransferase involved in cell wall biosynthesis